MRCGPRLGCSNGRTGGNSLRDFVLEYEKECRPKLQKQLDWFREQPSIQMAIENAALARDDRGKRYSHQRRHPHELLRRAHQLLLDKSEMLRRCLDFDDLVAAVTDALGKMKGLKELYCYDTALRIGAFREIYPDKIYLHRGARTGARNLQLNFQTHALRKQEVPAEIRSLRAYEIEDFLCIYKAEFGRIKKGEASGP
jgi:hypothetical protein